MGAIFTEDQLLDMTEKEFKAEYQKAKQSSDHEQELKRLAEEQKIREEEQAENQKRLILEAEEKARKDAEIEIEKLKQDVAIKEELERKKAEQAKNQELEEAEKLRKNTQYQEWLKENDFNKDTDIVNKLGDTFVLYRKYSEIVIN